MIDQPFDAAFEQHIQEIAGQMTYPPTPDLAATLARPVGALRPALSARRWALAALGLLVVIAALMAVPPVRAAVLEFIRIGAVRILVGEPTVTPVPTSMPLPPRSGVAPIPQLPVTATSAGPQTTGDLADLSRLYGETTLEAARAVFHHPIKLPTYPPDLGRPDRVYRQNYDQGLIILVWLQPGDPRQVRMSLHIITDDTIIYKFEPKIIQSTTVNGEKAVWLEGPYPLMVTGPSANDMVISRLMVGKSLVWAEASTGLTYRLESDLTLDEAIKVAESIK